MTGYPYCGPAMLERSEHYMFSPYGGAALLDAWRASRQGFDPERAAAATAGLLAATAGAAGGDDAGAVRQGPGRRAIATLPILDAMVALAVRAERGPGFDRWLDVFHRKFEVAKRLRAGYSHDLKGQGGHADWSVYPRLGYLLASGAALDRDMRRLNALLKANDLALSVPAGGLDRIGSACLAVAAACETAAVAALCARLGLDTPG